MTQAPDFQRAAGLCKSLDRRLPYSMSHAQKKPTKWSVYRTDELLVTTRTSDFFAMSGLNLPIQIRLATIDDAESIERIWREGSSTSLGFQAGFIETRDYFIQCIQDGSDTFKFWVATDYIGNIIGWQSLRPTEANPIMRNLVSVSSTYVDPCCRIRGVGTALVKQAMQHADESSLHYITACVSTKNCAVIKIAFNLGWQKVGVIPSSSKHPCVPEAISIIYIANAKT
jgi:L-amino acid N-acyltransferase YncA